MPLPYILEEKSVLRKPNSEKSIQQVLDEAYDWIEEFQANTSLDNKFFYANVYDSESRKQYFVYTNAAKDYFALNSNVIEMPIVAQLNVNGDGVEEFSEEETLTNKVWFGKPVYRKVLTGNTDVNGEDMELPIDAENIDKIWVDGFKIFLSSGAVISEAGNFYIEDARELRCYILDNNTARLLLPSNANYGQYKNVPYYITLEYTKTTD